MTEGVHKPKLLVLLLNTTPYFCRAQNKSDTFVFTKKTEEEGRQRVEMQLSSSGLLNKILHVLFQLWSPITHSQADQTFCGRLSLWWIFPRGVLGCVGVCIFMTAVIEALKVDEITMMCFVCVFFKRSRVLRKAYPLFCWLLSTSIRCLKDLPSEKHFCCITLVTDVTDFWTQPFQKHKNSAVCSGLFDITLRLLPSDECHKALGAHLKHFLH